MNLAGIGAVAGLPCTVSLSANYASGYLPLALQAAGWSVNRTRKSIMALATVLSPVGNAAVFAPFLFWTMTFISVAIFFWMFWPVTVRTLPWTTFLRTPWPSCTASAERARRWAR